MRQFSLSGLWASYNNCNNTGQWITLAVLDWVIKRVGKDMYPTEMRPLFPVFLHLMLSPVQSKPAAIDKERNSLHVACWPTK